jgi:fluoride exporter
MIEHATPGIALGIALAAAIGAPARFVVERWVTDRAVRRASAGPARWWAMFPWGLLAVNAVGSAVAGASWALMAGGAARVVLVGFCGAFTTFSGFGWQVVHLWRQDRRACALAIIAMPTACIVAFLLAQRIAHLAVG